MIILMTIGIVFVIIGFITLGFIIINLQIRTDAIKKIVEGLSLIEIWEGTINQTLRSESLDIYWTELLTITAPIIAIGIIFIILTEITSKKMN